MDLRLEDENLSKLVPMFFQLFDRDHIVQGPHITTRLQGQIRVVSLVMLGTYSVASMVH